jgi:histidinol-phosphate aminotransferase
MILFKLKCKYNLIKLRKTEKMFANKYIKALKPYPLVSHKAWESDEPDKILKLDWNEATIPPSPNVKENIVKFLKDGKLNWYPNVNNTELLEKIANYNNIPLDNVQYFASSDALHEYIIKTFVDPEDKITIIGPTYDNFRAVAEANGALVSFYHLGDNFELNVEHFKNYLKLSVPKIVYICNPNNPTGTLHQVKDIERIISEFPNIMFVVDEAYYEFTKISCKALVLNYDNILISRTFSKAFALASFRIGYAISSQYNLEILSKIRNPKSVSSLSQVAVIAVLDDLDYMEQYVDKVIQAKKYFKDELKKIKIDVFEDGGNFVLLRLSGMVKQELILFLENNNIFVRDYGHVKNMEDFLRITIGTKEQMQIVVKNIRSFFNEK